MATIFMQQMLVAIIGLLQYGMTPILILIVPTKLVLRQKKSAGMDLIDIMAFPCVLSYLTNFPTV